MHGPKPRSYAQRTPKKMIAAALLQALSDRARNGRVHVVDAFVEGDKPSTKSALALLNKVSSERSALVVVSREDDLSVLSLRNAAEAHDVYIDQLNTYDVLVADDVVFTESALTAFVEKKRKEEK